MNSCVFLILKLVLFELIYSDIMITKSIFLFYNFPVVTFGRWKMYEIWNKKRKKNKREKRNKICNSAIIFCQNRKMISF